MEAFIMMIIFSVALMLAALRLYYTKKPKDSILMYKYQGLYDLSEEAAHEAAQRVAKGVGVFSIVPLIGGIVGLYNVTAGGLILIFGSFIAMWLIGKLFQKK